MKMKMMILVVESLLVIVLLPVHSHQLDQRQALHNLYNKSRQSQYDVSRNFQSFYTAQNLVIQPQDCSQDNDRIDGGLPGQPPDGEFAQYSGYVTVNSSTGRALFYYFAEAASNPFTSPLVLWLNGGPGCSSLGIGAMQELGPFGVNPDGKTLYARPYAWNQVANTLFLESPAGVGFSYSNTTSDYNSSGDKRTAEDSYAFLVNWFERFPQYKYRDFYITGESYAGHYIPELADTILYHKRKSEAPFINLKGIMVGNGLIHGETDNNGRYDYMWTHALISDQTHNGIRKFCNFSMEAPYSPQCENFISKADAEIGNIDYYNIYAPICLQSSSKNASSRYVGQQEGDQIAGYDPCSHDYIHTYLNTVDVQRAMHVANAAPLPYPWNKCSGRIAALWRDQVPSMFPFYREFIQAGLQVLIYSGDVDAMVPVTSTRRSINGLKLPIETSWYPWIKDNEVGGYSVIYKGLTFVTVRGAGHEVPSFQSARALTILKSFLGGKPLPKAPDS